MASIVLVHGAFQGGWVWKWTAEALAERGHTAHRPSLSGCGQRRRLPDPRAGLRVHADEIVQYILDEGLTDVTLVGHSYAGLVCCAAADMLPELVTRLVLVDAVLPQPGRSFADMGGEPFAQMLTAHDAGGGMVRPWPLASFGVGDDAAPWFERRLGLFPLAAFTEPYPEELPPSPAQRVYISCIPAKNPLLRTMATRASAEGWEAHALMSGHCAMIAAPLELAGLLHSVIRGAPPARAPGDADLPPLDRRLLEDMRRQLHWTCCRLAKGEESHAPESHGDRTPACPDS